MEEMDVLGLVREVGLYLLFQKRVCFFYFIVENGNIEVGCVGKSKKFLKFRFIQKLWFVQFSWLVVNEEQTVFFCFVCREYLFVRDKRLRLIEGYIGSFKVEIFKYYVKSKVYMFCVNVLVVRDFIWVVRFQSIRNVFGDVLVSSEYFFIADYFMLYSLGFLGVYDNVVQFLFNLRVELEDFGGNGVIFVLYLDCIFDLR